MGNKLISIQEAVAKYTWDGMTYAHGSAYPVGADSIAFGRAARMRLPWEIAIDVG